MLSGPMKTLFTEDVLLTTMTHDQWYMKLVALKTLLKGSQWQVSILADDILEKIMSPTSKKFRGHLVVGLFLCPSFCESACNI